MKLLAIETSTEACSIALWIDGEVRERHALAPRQHAELSLPWADALLAEAGIVKSQLDVIAVGRGPGAFTGVRLGVALAQGIAMALDRPVVPVSTLAALAMRARSFAPAVGEGDGGLQVLAAIDARMNELYVAAFELRDGDAIALCEESLVAPDAVALPPQGRVTYGVGSGFAALGGVLRARMASTLTAIDADALPHAGDVAALAVLAYGRGEAVAPERLEPAYLRNQVALTITQQQALRAERSQTSG